MKTKENQTKPKKTKGNQRRKPQWKPMIKKIGFQYQDTPNKDKELLLLLTNEISRALQVEWIM